jgi:hypothetical protein
MDHEERQRFLQLISKYGYAENDFEEICLDGGSFRHSARSLVLLYLPTRNLITISRMAPTNKCEVQP